MKYLKELANVYWARPENALWITKVMQALDETEFVSPSLDLMCGHGIWSFIRAGGDFGLNFDCYQVTKNLKEYQEGVDIQNTFSETYNPEIVRRPKYRVSCGLDWKENNLKKCEKLDFYDRLVQADCNERLPFEDGEFMTVFSNTVYWVDNIDHILKELERITAPGGKIILVNYLPAINNYLDVYKGNVSDKWLHLIDRNRSVENKHIFTFDEWNTKYDSAGLKTIEYIPTVNQLFAHIWNIGLRPFAGNILQMVSHMTAEEFLPIKEQWVDTLVTLAEPFLTNSKFTNVIPGNEAEGIFILQRK